MQSVVIFGFGAQGQAQAHNLRDGGYKVSVYLRPESPKLPIAQTAGFSVIQNATEAAQKAEIAVFLLPDAEQPIFWENNLKPHLPESSTLIFAHGFNIHFKQLTPRPDIDVLLAAPFLHADRLRKNFVSGAPVTIMTAVHQDPSSLAYRTVEQYAAAIGGQKVRILPTTFQEETETDLFAEQSILVGGLLELIQASAETLIRAGYSETLAHQCCLRELLPMAEVLDQTGLPALYDKISDTARFGALTRGPRIIDDHVKQTLQTVLHEIRSGIFTEELLTDKKANWKRLQRRLAEEAKRPLAKLTKGS